jgi:DNA-binding MarR family transcriptional regulator
MLSQLVSRSQVDDLLFHFLMRIYRWEREIDAAFDLDYQQIYLLQHLRKFSPCCVSDIAQELRIPLFKTTRLVSRLADRGFLEKQKSKEDQRVVMVSLMPQGDEVLCTIEERSFQILANNAKNLSKEEITAFLLAAENIDKLLNLPEEA